MIFVRGCNIRRGAVASATADGVTIVAGVRSTGKDIIVHSRLGALS
jgi:hypothetical protein